MYHSIAVIALLLGIAGIAAGTYFGKTKDVVICNQEMVCGKDLGCCIDDDPVFKVCRKGELTRSGCSAKKVNALWSGILFAGVGACIVGIVVGILIWSKKRNMFPSRPSRPFSTYSEQFAD